MALDGQTGHTNILDGQAGVKLHSDHSLDVEKLLLTLVDRAVHNGDI